MENRNLRAQLTFLGLTLFFGCGLLLTHKVIAVQNVWDYVVVILLKLMSGLGLTIVIMWWFTSIRNARAEARQSLPVKVPRGTSGRCG